MKNKDINKTFKVISHDTNGEYCQASAPRGYVQASDYAKQMLSMGHTNVEIKISFEKLTDGWQSIETAPKDGQEIEILVRHHNWQYASEADKPDWQQACKARWIDHNGGGWTWSGLAGTAIAWRHLK